MTLGNQIDLRLQSDSACKDVGEIILGIAAIDINKIPRGKPSRLRSTFASLKRGILAEL